MIALQSSMMTLKMLIVKLATWSVLSRVESVTDSVKLHNGALMPLLARRQYDPIYEQYELDYTDINQQLENKYRHFIVHNDGTRLGNVMHKWVFNGKLNYESIFITVLPTLRKPEDVSKRLDILLEMLQVSYVDLYLLDHNNNYNNFLQMWKEMEAQVRARKAKAIGVYGYERGETIDRLIKYSTILPAVVSRPESHYMDDKSFSDYLANLGIATMVDDVSLRTTHGKIRDIAKRHNVSTDEIFLRYFTQQNITVITHWSVGFLKTFEFNLSKEDIDTIKSMSYFEI